MLRRRSVPRLTLCPGDRDRIQPNSQKYTHISPTRKIHLTKFTSSFIKSVIPSPSNSNSSPNNQDSNNHSIQVSTIAVVIVVVSLFSTSSYMHTYIMLILINPCLLKVVLSMTKTLNNQNSPKQNFYAPTFQCYLENPASLNACFPLFPTFLFHTL